MQGLKKLAKPIVLAVVLAIAVLPTFADMAARRDGETAGKANASKAWFAAGCLLDLIGVAGAYLIVPDPPAEALMGKTADYVADYTAGYKDAIRGEDTKYALYGWGTEVVVSGAACCCLSVVSAAGTASTSGQ